MKERPLLFSAPMVRATIEKRKTKTRRTSGLDKVPEGAKFLHLAEIGTELYACFDIGKPDWFKVRCPYGVPGDELWVKEPYSGEEVRANDDGGGHLVRIAYDAGGFKLPPLAEFLAWERRLIEHGRRAIQRHNPMYMPRWASRISLVVKSVRVERLQEITNEDARLEGTPYACPHRHGYQGIELYGEPDLYAHKHNTGINDCWICGFRSLWESINGPGSWNANPWVWVIEFEVKP